MIAVTVAVGLVVMTAFIAYALGYVQAAKAEQKAWTCTCKRFRA